MKDKVSCEVIKKFGINDKSSESRQKIKQSLDIIEQKLTGSQIPLKSRCSS